CVACFRLETPCSTVKQAFHMLSPSVRPSSAPRVIGVGLHRLRDLLQELAPSYRGLAQLEILDRGFDTAVNEIRKMHAAEPIDVIVAAGSNGAYLRQHVDIPVVLVRVGGFDLMRALARARSISPRIALVTHGDIPREVQQFDELFG